MSRSDSLGHALCGIRSAARANTFHRQDTVSEDQGKKRRDATDAEAGRDIPRGTDEESNAEHPGVDRGKSAKRSTSGAQRPPADRHREE